MIRYFIFFIFMPQIALYFLYSTLEFFFYICVVFTLLNGSRKYGNTEARLWNGWLNLAHHMVTYILTGIGLLPDDIKMLLEPIMTYHNRSIVVFLISHEIQPKVIRNRCWEMIPFKLLPNLLGVNELRENWTLPRVSLLLSHNPTATMPWCMPGSLTSGFLWSPWQGKRSLLSWCMRNPQSYISDKRTINK